ncbi:MAG: bacteriohemerythrin [Gammaproteobacteria bacterium]|nr:bacteriohemerythrin [Gammaproteobacteria bacterium]MBU1623735.1 bacteriohemerythrin [Gammaproteobacteria bacterium]
MKSRYQPSLVLTSVLLALLLGGWLVFGDLRKAIHVMVEDELAAVATLKGQQIEQWFDDRSADADTLGADSFFARAVQQWYDGARRDGRQRNLIRKQLQGFLAAHEFDAAVLLDRQGRVALQVGDVAHDVRHAQAHIMQAMERAGATFIDLHQDEAGTLEMDFITSLRVDGRVVGALYLMENATAHLFPLLTSTANAGELIETHLVRRDGDRVMFLSPLRGMADAPLSHSLPFSDRLGSALALSGQRGLLEQTLDYLGRPVLSYAVPVRRTDWVLLANAQEKQAYALVNRLEYIAIPLMLLLLLLTTAWFWQWQRRQRADEEMTRVQIILAGEERFHTVFDHAAFAMARHALNGDIMEVNDKWCSTFGYTRKESAERNMNWQQLTYPADRGTSAQEVKRLLSGEAKDLHLEKRYVRKNGQVFWGETQVSLVRNTRGEADYFVSAVQDIDARKRLEEERESNLTLLQMALDAAQEAVWEWDLVTGQAKFSPEYYTMLGYLPDEFPANQKEWLARIHPDDRDKVWRTIQEELKHHQDIYVTEYRMLTKDGRYRWLQGRGKCVEVDAQGGPMRLVGINIDIHDRKQAELQVSYLAYHDKLTGLPNRALFFDRFSQAISRAKRDHRRVALLFADLDGFKQVNDVHGHEAGDAVLRMAAQRLLACLRAVDTAVRFGGDEFAVIVSDVDDAHQVSQVAEKIVNAFEAEMMLEQGASCQIGVSIGISIFPDNGSTMDGLLIAADQAMYDSKHAGKNTYTFFGEQESVVDEQWIKFDQSHLIGVSELDEQHRNLVRMVNKLNSEWRKGAAHEALLSLFDELVTATAEHFETEGRYMAQYAYPEQRAHEKEHALLVDEAMRLRKGLSDGGELLALQTIKDWLVHHILHADTTLAKYLIAQGVR